MYVVIPLLITVLFLISSPAGAQVQAGAAGGVRKQARAVRLEAGTIRVDGRLDDEAWQLAPPITDFIQKEPVEGAPPTERMDVRFLYDDSTLYVGARMYSRAPSTIRAPLGRRDDVTSQADHIIVALDTYLDRRTAYAFGVTASGVRLDRFHSQDDELDTDADYDPVWEAKVGMDDEGWTAEMWIPLSQLRFNQQPENVWGLNVQRFTPALNEEDYWAPVPRTERGWASRFGDLRGIEGIRPPRRLELLPYLASSSTMNGNRDFGNPFDDGRNLAGRIGADIKIGFGSGLTLDATVNPDFGQVEADPAEVNLTDFETRFSERRPFFREGAQLLTINHPSAFYSRRIGARPAGPASGDFVAYPSDSTILAAAKVTGRLQSGTSIGLLSAVTDNEFARMSSRDRPGVSRLQVAARTIYNVGRIQQEFGPLASTASLMAVSVHRDLSPGHPLAALMPRNAFIVGGDTLLRFKGGEYELSVAGLASYINGDPEGIEVVQRSSTHYMQRPDQNYSVLDPTRSTMGGFTLLTNISRTGGRHWLWSFRGRIDSPEFEPKDVGNLTAADGLQPTLTLRYRETRPGKIFRSYSMRLTSLNEWNWGGARHDASLQPQVDLTWSNFWTTQLSGSWVFRAHNWALTRGGPLMETPRSWTFSARQGNSSASQTRWSAEAAIGGDEDGGNSREVEAELSFRPGPRWQVQIEPSYERMIDTQQYVSTLDGGRAATFDKRYIFAHIERSTFSTAYRLNFTLRPDVNLDVYGEPFAASGRYYDLGEQSAPKTRERIVYGTSGTTVSVAANGDRVVTADNASFRLRNRDFNTRSFRSNIVMRWEWRPGSTLYLVWQQDRHASDPIGTRVGLGDVFNSITETGSNIFLIKTSFWLPVK